MATTARIQGVFTPHMVPLDDQGQILEEELRRYVDWLIDHGVHGLYPNGSTGEFVRFTAPERRRIIEIVCSQTAGRVPVLAGAAEANVRETLAACEAYAQFGATAVAIVSPFYYRLSPESVYAYFREIALASPIDVTLYNIPMFASPIDIPTIKRLAEFPRVVGIKDSSGDVAFMMRLISAVRPLRPDFSFLTGWEAVLVPMLLVGCDGGTHATSGVVPEITRKLYDLTRGRAVRGSPALAIPAPGAFRRHALLGRLPRGIPGGRGAAGVPHGPEPPAHDRRAAGRSRGAGAGAPVHSRRFRLRLTAHWKAAPREAASRPPTGCRRSSPASSMSCASEAPCERRTGFAGDSGTDPLHGGPGRAGKDSFRGGDPDRAQRPVWRLHEDSRTGCRRAGRHRGGPQDRRTDGRNGHEPRHRPREPAPLQAILSPPEFNPLIQQDVVFEKDVQTAAARNSATKGVQEDAIVSQESGFALGFIETQGFTAVFAAIDTACKAANVEIVGKEKLGGGFVTVVVKGDVASVKAAIEAGKAEVESLGKLIAAHVIPRPSPSVLGLLPQIVLPVS